MVAAPFYSDFAASLLGFKNGANTSLIKYLQMSKLLGGEKGKEYGALYSHTIYWGFLPEDVYFSEPFLFYLKLAILSSNIYYFFIKHFCLVGCISQLFKPCQRPLTLSSRS